MGLIFVIWRKLALLMEGFGTSDLSECSQRIYCTGLTYIFLYTPFLHGHQRNTFPHWHLHVVHDTYLTVGGLLSRGLLQHMIPIRNIAKSRSSISPISVAQSFWNFAKSTTVTLPCFLQNCKMIRQLRNKLIQTRFRESWVWGEFWRDILFCNSPLHLRALRGTMGTVLLSRKQGAISKSQRKIGSH